jgi:glycine/D-amino acid oxidase-like deaminating enzyme
MQKRAFIWGDLEKSTFPILKNETSCSWMIVGGGIAGLATAYFLLEAGETDIVIIEKNTIGSGSTGHSAGMLVYEPEHARWAHYVKKYGPKVAKSYMQSQLDALSLVQHIIKRENIACDYEREHLLELANTKPEILKIVKDTAARKAIGQPESIVARESLSKELQAAGYLYGEKVHNEISVNPLAFARGFAKVLKKRGVRIYENSPMLSIKNNRVVTQRGVVTFEHGFLCLGVQDSARDIKKFVTTICLTRKLKKAELAQFGFGDTSMFLDDYKSSFLYGKLTSDKRMLFGFGDVALTKKTEGSPHLPHIRQIEQFVERRFPLALPFEYSWSAAYSISLGDVPLVKVTKNTTRINGGGTQIATIAAADYAVAVALKKKHPLSKLYQ